MRYSLWWLAMLILMGCGGGAGKPPAQEFGGITPGITSKPAITEEDIDTVSNANNDFSFDIYHYIKQDGDNHFLSSYSLYTMLNMLLSSAQGDTKEEMRQAGKIVMDEMRWERAFKALHKKTIAFLDTNNSGFRFSFANSFWLQNGLDVNEEFIDKMEKIYGTEIQTVDFAGDSDAARDRINAWTSEKTDHHIEELLDEDAVNEDSKIILVNAMYIKALWTKSFSKNETAERPFFLSDGSEIAVPTMHQVNRFRYVHKNGVQVVCMRYKESDFGLVSFLPEKGKLDMFEASLDNEMLDYFAADFAYTKLDLYYPKIEIKSATINLNRMLIEKGMVTAFGEGADFSGISTDSKNDLRLSQVVQKIYFKIDEEGTEAASSTAVSIGTTDAQEAKEVKFDHPFIIMICHIPTRTVLFMGRVVDPR